MLDLLAQGRLPTKGFVRQEQIGLADFLANRFGHVYAPQGSKTPDTIVEAAA